MSRPLPPASARLLALLSLSGCAAEPPRPGRGAPDAIALDTGAPLAGSEGELLLEAASAATLRLHVSDLEGRALAEASVRVSGRGARTDSAGDAVLPGFRAGDALVVQVSSPGYGRQVRRVQLAAPGANRLSMRLAPRDLDCDDGACDVATGLSTEDETFTVGSFDLNIRPGTLVDANGASYDGAYEVELQATETHSAGASLAASPGSLLTLNDGEEDVLRSLGMLSVDLRSPDGAPLFLAEDATATVSRDLPAGVDTGPGEDEDEIRVYYLDEGQGRWEPYAGVDVEREALSDGGTRLSAALPHFCAVNFDLAGRQRCAVARTRLPESLRSGAELEVESDTVVQRFPASAEDQTLLGLGHDPVTLRLYLYDGLVATRAGVVPARTDASTGACAAEATELRPENVVPVAAGDSALILRVRAGDCPAADFSLSLTDPAGAPVDLGAAGDGRSPTLWLQGLEAGEYTVTAWDAEGRALATQALRLEEGEAPTLAELDLDDAFASAPMGGCAPLPCEGADCDTCLVVSVRDGGAPVPGEELIGPDQARRATDPDGEVCFDLPALAEAEVTVLSRSGLSGQATLGRGGSCAAGGCATLALSADDDAGCAAGSGARRWDSAWLGGEDPGFYDEDRLGPPSGVALGRLDLWLSAAGLPYEEVTDEDHDPVFAWLRDSDPLAEPSCAAEPAAGLGLRGAGQTWRCEVAGSNRAAWAWSSVAQSASGALSEGGWHLRALSEGGGYGLALDVDQPLSRLPLEQPVSAETYGARLRLWRRGLRAGEGYDWPFTDLSGDLTLIRVTASELTLRFDGEARDRRASLGGEQVWALSGSFTAPLISAASFPRALETAAARPLLGSRATVLRAEDPQGVGYGPAAAEGEGAKLGLCLPEAGRFQVVGEAVEGALRPFSPLLTMEGGRLAIAAAQDVAVNAGTAVIGVGGGLGGGPGAGLSPGGALAFQPTVGRDRSRAMHELGYDGIYSQTNIFKYVVEEGFGLNRGDGPVLAEASVAEPVFSTPRDQSAWISTALRWLSRDLAGLLADAAGELAPDFAHSALVLGRLQDCDGAACSTLPEGQARLVPGFDTAACPIASPDWVDASGAFAFTHVDPACSDLDHPAQLLIFTDDSLEELAAVLPFVAVAGGAMVLPDGAE